MNKYKTLEDFVKKIEERGNLKEISNDISKSITKVKHISYNSKDVSEGTLFVCKGASFSPKYLKEAAENGAFAYVSENKIDEAEDMTYLGVEDVRTAMADIANLYFDEAWKNFKLTGITGTKGKSGTAYFLKSILDDYLKERDMTESGIISGIDVYDGRERFEAHLTTPETFELHRHFSNGAESGIEYMTMEVSSQALKYHRTLGIKFDAACFLNIGKDHISDNEHKDFDDYFSAKLKIFEQCKYACINVDSAEKNRILAAAKKSCEYVTFGFSEEADVKAENITPTKDGMIFSVNMDGQVEFFELSMVGEFNIYNALAAICVSRRYGIPLKNIKAGLKKAKVSGRMELFEDCETGKTAIVDYAHNIMSFEALFTSVKKQFPESNMSIVFGCPGNKAISRRRELGELAGKYAKKTYITEEDPGEESLESICEEIAEAVETGGGKYDIIYDRVEAITVALEEADSSDIVLITGKGRETRQKRGKEYIDTLSDVDIVKKILGKR